MGRMKDFVIRQEMFNKEPAADWVEDDIFAGDDSDNGIGSGIDLYRPIDFNDLDAVLGRIFAVVETYPMGGESAWWFFLNDWDRRFVLNIYDMWITTGRTPLSEKQIMKSKVILRKMMTPAAGSTTKVGNEGE